MQARKIATVLAAAALTLTGLAGPAMAAGGHQSRPAQEIFHALSLTSGNSEMIIGASAKSRRDTIHVLNETSGSFAMRDANNGGSGSAVVEGAKGVFGPAVDFQWQDIGTQSNYNGTTRENGKIFALGHSGLCVGGGPGSITLVSCSTGTGTVMAEVVANGAFKFQSRLYSDPLDGDFFITGDGNSGQLQFEEDGNHFQRWSVDTGTNKVKAREATLTASVNPASSYKPHMVNGIMAFATHAQGVAWFKAHPDIVTHGQICDVSGNHFCGRDMGDVDGSTPIVNGNHVSGGGSAVNVMLNDAFTTFRGDEVYEIQFVSHADGYCWAVQGSASSSNQNMLTRFCTAYGTAWAADPSGAFINRGATNANGGNLFAMSTDLGLGQQWFVDPLPFKVDQDFHVIP